MMRSLLAFAALATALLALSAEAKKAKEKPDWAKKDIHSYR